MLANGQRYFPCVVISTVLLLFSNTAVAEVYRWVDKSGKVHFSDKKPQDQNKSVESIEVNAPPIVDNPELERTRQQNRARFEALDAERELKAKQQAQINAAKKRKHQHCSFLRRKLAAYEKAAYLYKLDKNGERIIQEDKTKQKAIQELKKVIRKEC